VLLYTLFEYSVGCVSAPVSDNSSHEEPLWSYCSDKLDVMGVHFVPSTNQQCHSSSESRALRIAIVHTHKVTLYNLNLILSISPPPASSIQSGCDDANGCYHIDGLWCPPAVTCAFDVDEAVVSSLYVSSGHSLPALYILHEGSIDAWILPVHEQCTSWTSSPGQATFEITPSSVDYTLPYEDFKFTSFMEYSHSTFEDGVINSLRSANRSVWMQQGNASLLYHLDFDSLRGNIDIADTSTTGPVALTGKALANCSVHCVPPLSLGKVGREDADAISGRNGLVIDVFLWGVHHSQTDDIASVNRMDVGIEESVPLLLNFHLIQIHVDEICALETVSSQVLCAKQTAENAVAQAASVSSTESRILTLNMAIIALEKKACLMNNIFAHVTSLLQQGDLSLSRFSNREEMLSKLAAGATAALDISLQCRLCIAQLEHNLALIGDIDSDEISFRFADAQYFYLKEYRIRRMLEAATTMFTMVQTVGSFMRDNVIMLIMTHGAREESTVTDALVSCANEDGEEEGEEYEEDRDDVYWALGNIVQCVWHIARDCVIEHINAFSAAGGCELVQLFLYDSTVMMKSTELDISLAVALVVYSDAVACCKVT
jgi:hypothetical protein